MIKLKKLYIENFKGINESVEIDFFNEDLKVNVLSGPNGFGKTTIFEVIELCLTGSFHRIMVFDNVQKKTKNRKKPFYQNTAGKDVILKLLFNNTEGDKDYVIIKHFDEQNSPKSISVSKQNIPSDSSNFFLTYLSDNEEFFSSNNFTGLEEVSQSTINELFYGSESKTQLSSSYYLFNYLQQEDSIYFLKKDEDNKGKSLSFLFNIEEEEIKRNAINDIYSSLNEKSNQLSELIQNKKETVSSVESREYFKLFDENNFDFDKSEPFEDIEDKAEHFNTLNEELNELLYFRDNFSPLEYEKYVHFRRIDKFLSQDALLTTLLLSKIYTEEINDQINESNRKYRNIDAFINREEKTIIEKKIFEWLIDEGTLEEYNDYTQLTSSIREIDKDLGEIGKIVSDLLSAREQTVLEFNKLIEENQIEEDHCPLCNTQFESHEKLIEQIDEQTKRLQKYNETKLQSKKELIRSILVISEMLEKNATVFLLNHNLIGQDIQSLFRGYTNFKKQIDEFITLYSKIDSEETQELFFTSFEISEEVIEKNTALIRKYIEESIQTDYSYDERKVEQREYYQRYFNNDSALFNQITPRQLESKIDFINYRYNVVTNEKIQFLEERLLKLNRLRDKSFEIRETVNALVKNYKSEMINKIKIPFYIYSGKILQSYQQGLGIFIDIRETGQSNKVVFKTGHSSDHDIVYHLSSGQMAVASIAFCLSLNKVYNTNENFRFLAIDDPIQTMDDLNIHTFIEVLRHDFKDYQLIMSTHDDFTSKYIKYKFDKFDFKTDIKNVQQLVLEQTMN